jgi:hypothetical protein
MQFLPIEPYGYAVVYSTVGDKITITSLLVPDIYEKFGKVEGVVIDKKKRLMASPSLERIIGWINKDGV